ncbi:MAG: FliG C-terminal domain-containing protein [Elusimicrobiales bacterium]|nr:FliG C-terminal domain-containing protein [Elusimicrobiales bacterium]
MTKSFLSFVWVLVSLLSSWQYAFSQALPFEEKAKYERALEQKVDEVLIRLLGPNQAKVVVEATMDFSRTEKLEVSSAGNPAKGSGFKWQSAGGDAQSGDYLMPGFPAYGAGGGENKAYNRQMLSPSAFVKKMAVSIILNRNLPDTAVDSVRQVVSEMLLLDMKRGDRLMVIKAPFAPMWRTVWYTPEALSMVAKYVLISLMGFIAMVVVAVGFLKLAGAMSAMAKVQQSHQITMEMGKGAEPGGGMSGQPASLSSASRSSTSGPSAAQEEKEGRTLIGVSLEQVPFLVSMMSNEDAANVALVVAHLSPEVKNDFLKKLSPAFASDVIIHLSRIRFVEPEVIATLKEELERRLSGAVGGISGALEAIDGVDLRGRRDLLAELSRKNPELAAEVRKHMLLPEDLVKLSEREFSLLAGVLKPEEWAAALFDLPDGVKTQLKGQMADRTWQMIEQSMNYGAPPREKIEGTLARLMAAAGDFVKEGKIMNPSSVNLPMIENEKEAA